MPPRVAVYLRVSTDHQTHDSQEIEMREYCARRGWPEPQWVRDTASGALQSREGLNALMVLARRGKIDVLLTFKLDRLARSLSHLAQVLAELQAHRVALICPSQGIDTSNANPAAQLQINILAAVAQFEREIITERVRAGVKAAKEKGVRLGRPKNESGRKKVTSFLAEGLSLSEISRRSGIPRSTVSAIAKEIRLAAPLATQGQENHRL
jgi:putative DNA-invertase from lambdoid prophage Rac